MANEKISEEAKNFMKYCLLPLHGENSRRTADELLFLFNDTWFKEFKSTTMTSA